MVLTRLRRGWNKSHIARDLGITRQAVQYHADRLRADGEFPDLQEEAS